MAFFPFKEDNCQFLIPLLLSRPNLPKATAFIHAKQQRTIWMTYSLVCDSFHFPPPSKQGHAQPSLFWSRKEGWPLEILQVWELYRKVTVQNSTWSAQFATLKVSSGHPQVQASTMEKPPGFAHSLKHIKTRALSSLCIDSCADSLYFLTT